MAVFPFAISSIFTLARTVMEPFPVKYALRIPPRPKINPPVGKSGPEYIPLTLQL